ncbi:gamma-glutamyltransferase [Novosphingobium tardum]|uniref:Glutathione hydrolase proenzyme n=1 Tax=Novosphingobium tardum TaxID=1538021 RepID=A0ABV8RKD5_9SPHN
MKPHILLSLCPLALAACATLPQPSAAPAAPPRIGQLDSAQVGVQGLVSAADPRAAEAGAEMLRLGGSATDAAIATMLALTVVEPQSSGIGGGGFLLMGDAAGNVDTIDGRETAPAAATGDWFMRGGKPMEFADAQPGGKSVGVPGSMRLVALAHRSHGKLAWKTLFGPAIRLARNGFAVTPRLNHALSDGVATGGFDAAARAIFYDSAGTPRAVGTTIRNPALATTLERIAARGAGDFYSGANAREIASKVSAAPHNPAPMTVADITAYDAKARPAVCGSYRGYRICGMGPPSSGATTVQAILGQLERFDLKALGPQSPVAWHLIAESERLAYADREKYLADGDFIKVPVAGLTDPSYLAQRGELISPDRTLALVQPGTPPGARLIMGAAGKTPEEHGTSHFVVVDRSGNSASYTSTIESAFGSGIMVGGYYLNNELTDFSFVPDVGGIPVANRVEGGKRPRSSMSPTLIYGPDGKLKLALGAAGGATIIVQVAKAIIGVIDWGLPAQQAIALPVLFAPGGNTVMVEKDSALEAMIPALKALGHADVQSRPMPLKANAIERVGDRWVGAADPRSEGAAVAQ